MSTANSQFAVNRAIDAIKIAQMELSEVDLRTVPVASRKVIKDARSHLTLTRQKLSNPLSNGRSS